MLCLSLLLCLPHLVPAVWLCEEEPWLCEEGVAIGELEDEKLRYQQLVSLRVRVDNESDIATELDNIIWVADHWANGLEKFWSSEDNQVTGEDGYLGGWFMFRTVPWGVIWPFEPRAGSPCHPLWCLYRGRMLIWNAVENGFRAEEFFKEGVRLLEEAREVFPGNKIIDQYFPESWSGQGGGHRDYPAGWEWVEPQHQALVGLSEVMRFWCEQRQAGDGQLGGGWGDDVEVWRDWVTVLLGFREQDLEDCWKNVAVGALSRPRMSGGYTDHMTDVEHSAEETGDTLTSLLHLDPLNNTWAEWAGGRLPNLAYDIWTGINHHGRRQFKSTYLSSDSTSGNPVYACDTAYHSRVLQPSMLAWQRGDYRPGGVILEWLETYIAAAETEERGKPAGVIPSALSWPSGTVGGWSTTAWDNPGCHYSQHTYAWPRGVENIMKALLLAYHLTANNKFLEPIRAAAERQRSEEDDEEKILGSRGLKVHNVLAQYRDITGDKQYDDLILQSGDEYQKFVISGDPANLALPLQRRANLFLKNREVLTSEVRFSDRIFKFKDAFINKVFNTTLLDTSASFQLLFSTVTGSVGDAFYFPRQYVKWWSHPAEISALVRKVVHNEAPEHRTELELRVWSHVDTDTVDLRFQLVNMDSIDMTAELVCSGDSSSIVLEDHGDSSYSFTVPSQSPCTLYLQIPQ